MFSNLKRDDLFIPSVFVFLFLTISILSAGDTLSFNQHFESINLSHYIKYYEDPTNDLTVNDLIIPYFLNQFRQPENENLNFGYSPSTFWLMIHIKNEEMSKMHPMRAMVFDYPNIQELDFYQVDTSGKVISEIKTGSMRPVDSRNHSDEKFVFMVSVPSGAKHTVFFKVRSEAPLSLGLQMKSMPDYLRSRYLRTIFNGIFIGLILLAVGYFTFLYFQLKDKSYLYLALTGAFLLVFNLTFSGLTYFHFIHGYPKLNQMLLPLSASLLMITFIQFSIEFLNLRILLPKWLFILRSLHLVFLVTIVCAFFIPFRLTDELNSYLILLTMYITLPAAFLSYKAGYKPARFFFLGLFIVAVSVTYTLLSETGLLKSSKFSEYGIQISSVVVIWFWANALAERIGLLRTEKEKAEGDFRTSQEQLALVVSGADLGTWDWDVKNNKIEYNNRWAEMLGFSLDELHPDPDTWKQLLHPEDKRIANETMAKHLNGTTEFYECEYRLRHKTGTWIWVLDKGRVVERDKAGLPLRATGTHVDISKIKNAEQELKTSENRFRLLFNSSSDSIMILSQDRIIDCNIRTLNLFSCTREQLIGKTPYEISPENQPDGKPSKEQALEKINSALAGQPQLFEWKHRRFDNGEFDVEVSLNVVEIQNGIYLQTILRDISERKRADHLLGILNEAALAMQKALTSDEIFSQVSLRLKKYGFRFNFFSYDKDKSVFKRKYLSFPKQKITQIRKELNINLNNISANLSDATVLQEVATKKKTVFLKEVTDFLNGLLPNHKKEQINQLITILDISNIILAPIISDDQVEGLITVESANLQASDVAAISIFTHQLAGALKRAQFFEQSRIEIIQRLKVEEALRRNEAQLQSILKAAPVGIGIFKDRAFLWFNNKLSQMTGYSDSELLNQDSRMLFANSNEYDSVWNKITKNLAVQKISEIETTWTRKDGNTLRIILSTAPTDSDTSRSQITFTVSDISDRILLEEQFRQAQKMEAIGQLAGGVAHDFNNILTVISGYSHLLILQSELDEKTKERLEQIKRASERAEALTRQLLAFSRKQIAQPKILDLNNIIQDSYKMLSRLIGEDINITLELDDKLPGILADPHQIEQVLINLLVNARDAIQASQNPVHKKNIIINTRHVYLDESFSQKNFGSSKGPKVVFSVSDSGIGIDKATQGKIFEPFFTTKDTGKGTGLGLATVYGIAKQNQAYITVDSNPGAGTVFKIYWPVAAIDEESSSSEEELKPYKVGAETILLVEDDPDVRTFAQEALRNLGYRVITANNSEDAIKHYEKNKIKPDLLLTDIVMPGINGIELSKELCKIHTGLKVIYASGYTDNKISKDGFIDEEINFIQKPYSLATLSQKIREALDEQTSDSAI